MIETRPFAVEDFSGGITDNFLDGAPNKYRFADNFVVTNNRKLYSRPGSVIYDNTNFLIPVGNQRIATLMKLNEDLLVQSAKKLYYIDGTYQTLSGPTGNDPFNAGDINSVVSWTDWNNHILVTSDAYPSPMKIFKDNGGNLQVRNCGLPALASSPTVTPGAGVKNYLYAFVYYYEYTVGNRTFVDYGPTTLVEALNADEPSSTSVSITGIPVLSNGATENWDTANIKVRVFRTADAGTDFYYVTEVTNGTTVASDTVSDTDLLSNETLYTNDGTLSQTPAPNSKFVHVTNNLGWYAHIKEGSEIYENRIIQSFLYNPDSASTSFFVDVDDVITGLSSFNFTPIVGCKNSLYRLDGIFTDDGQGGVIAQQISDVVGCVSNRSFVQTKKGTFFAGNDGFYWTDAFRVLKISDEFNDRYRNFVNASPEKIYGVYDEENDRVLWALDSNTGSNENDVIYCVDLKYGIKEDSCFTTWSNGSDFRPSALIYFNQSVLRADSRGYIFRHDMSAFSDPRVDVTAIPSLWSEKEIIYNYESCAYKFGTTFLRKFIPRIITTCSNETKLSLQINSINDKGRKTAGLKPIFFKNAITWGEDDIIWGDSTLVWNFDGIIEEQRRFPAKNLRCSYKQIQFTNAYVDIDTSTDTGTATVNSAGNLVTLDTGGATWPSSSVGYNICFSNDNYTNEFEVVGRTDSTLTVSDPGNLLVDGSYDWRLKGYPKNQVLNLIGYNIHYSLLGKTQPSFGTSGGNE